MFSEFVDAPDDLANLTLELFIDGELRQRGGPRQMLYPPDVILQALNHFATLEDSDIIMTGTPSGVGPVIAGSRFHARILDNENELTSASWVAQ